MAMELREQRTIILCITKDAQGNTVKTWKAEGYALDPAASNDFLKTGGSVAAEFAYDINDTQGDIEDKADAALKAKAGIA